MAYAWESELPALAALSEQAAADAINAITVQDTQYVFGSFRTLAGLLTQTEYNTLRAALKAVADQETAAGGFMVADMVKMLEQPGSEGGDGGGLDFTALGFIGMVTQLCTAASITEVPGKIAAHVAKFQKPPRPKYPHAFPNEIYNVRHGV